MWRGVLRVRYIFLGTLIVCALAIAASALVPAGANPQPQRFYLHPHPMTTVVSGSNTGAIFEAINSGFTAFNTFGLEGIVANAPGGIGVLGFGNNPSVGNYGVYGSVLGPNGTGVYGYAALPPPSGTTNTPSPSTLSTGLIGLSHTGFGLIGQADWPNTSNLVTNPIAGVEGVDQSTSVLFNLGVLGTTTNGGYGVAGESGNSALGGVLGLATSGNGVVGISTSDRGVEGSSTSFIGVDGSSSSSLGVRGVSSSSFGVEARSTSNAGLVALGDGLSSASIPNTNAIYAENSDSAVAPIFSRQDGTGPIFEADSSTGGSILIDHAGNVTISGTITTSGVCSSGCAAARRVAEYTPRTSVPTMEDVGESQLVGGQAYVRIDAAFANVIDRRSNYLVFVTPEGDSNGMYVTGKSASGFLVRENRNGRSTVAFQYRIVAKPIDSNEPRLPMVQLRSLQGTRLVRVQPMREAPMSAKEARFMAQLRAYTGPHPMIRGPHPLIH